MSGLAFAGVSHRFGSVVAVDAVDLEVRPGETVCLLGPSGCGKSTLLRLAAGLEDLQAGRIDIAGRTVALAGGHRRVAPEARGVGLVFQDYALFPHLTVLENIGYGLPGGRAAGEAQARRVLGDLGMGDLADRYPHALSGGQQQRVALLRSLAPKPRVMLLDEPFSTLDEHLRHEVRMETMRLLSGGDAATVLVTHDAEEAMLLGDRIVVMRDGGIVQDAAPNEVYAEPADLFTARLFGPVNRYEGTVRDGRVATPVGPVAASGFGESSRVEVAIRADGIELEDPVSAPRDRTRVQVRSVRPLGAWILALVTPHDRIREARGAGEVSSNADIQVRLPRGTAVANGDVLALHSKPEHTFVFSTQGRTRAGRGAPAGTSRSWSGA